MGLSLDSLVGGVKSLLGGTIGCFAGSVALGTGLLLGGAMISGCDEEDAETQESTELSDFVATPGNHEINLSWENPKDMEFPGAMIRRKVDTYPADSSDGDFIYEGMDKNHTDSGLDDHTNYCYTLFTFSYTDPTVYTLWQQASTTPFDANAPGDVSGINAVAGNQSVTLSWANPLDTDFSGIVVRRKLNSFPKDHNDGDLIYQGTDQSVLDTGLGEDVIYFYKIFCHDEVPNHSSGVAITGTPTDYTPPGDISGINITSGAHHLSLSWINPSTADFAGVVVRRRTDSSPSSPTDGTLVYQGLGQSLCNAGLYEDKRHFYKIFTFDEVPNFSSGISASARTLDVTGPAAVSSFSLVKAATSIDLSWVNPSDSDFTGVIIRRKINSEPTGPNNGIMVYGGTGQSFSDTGLSEDVVYFYKIFAYDEVPNFSSGVSASGTLLDVTSPANVSGLTLNQNTSTIDLSWVNPSNVDFAGILIRRKIDSSPSGPTDGTLIYQGTAQSFQDNISGDGTYNYAIYAYDEVPNYSSGVQTASQLIDTIRAIGWIGGGSDGWKTGSAPSSSSHYKAFCSPQGVFVDTNGNIYVSEGGNHRVSKWDSNGNAQGWIGGASDGWKQISGVGDSTGYYKSLNGPRGVFVDGNGNIYVSEAGNNRVSLWTSNGTAIGWLGGGYLSWTSNIGANAGTTEKFFDYPQDVFLRNGYMFVVDQGNWRISRYNCANPGYTWLAGSPSSWRTGTRPALPGRDVFSFWDPRGMYVDTNGDIYVADSTNERIIKRHSSGSSGGWLGGGSDGWHTGSAPSSGSGARSFNDPNDVFVANNHIYVVDTFNYRVSKWTKSGNLVGWLGGGSDGWKTGSAPSSGSDYKSLSTPMSVYVDSNGVIYITDSGNHRVSKWQD